MDLPSVQNVHTILLGGLLDGSDLLVRDGQLRRVVVADVAILRLADVKRLLWRESVDVILQLVPEGQCLG